MKLLRVGDFGKETVAALDDKGKIRDLSKHIEDLNPDTINFDNLKKLERLNLNELPEIDRKKKRINELRKNIR